LAAKAAHRRLYATCGAGPILASYARFRFAHKLIADLITHKVSKLIADLITHKVPKLIADLITHKVPKLTSQQQVSFMYSSQTHPMPYLQFQHLQTSPGLSQAECAVKTHTHAHTHITVCVL
jgi:hypothetical protein